MKKSSDVFREATGETLQYGTRNVKMDREIPFHEHFRSAPLLGDEWGWGDKPICFEICRIDSLLAYRIKGGWRDPLLAEIACSQWIPKAQGNAKPTPTNSPQPYFTLIISATAVAWYAALVSTGILVVQIANFLRDRKKVRLTLARRMAHAGDPFRAGMTFAVLGASNSGPRPLTIAQVYFQNLDRSGAIFRDIVPPLPCELTEGKYLLASLNEESVNFDAIRYFDWP